MTSQVAPFSGKAGGISIADFPSEVQETLKVFDADGSGSVQPGELALAAKMFQDSKNANRRQAKIIFFLIILIFAFLGINAALTFGVIEAAKESHVKGDGVMKSADSGKPVKVASASFERKMESCMPDTFWSELKTFVIRETAVYMELDVLGFVRMPRSNSLYGTVIILITHIGRITVDGTTLTFTDDVGALFKEAGFTMDKKGRRLMGLLDIVGFFNSIPEDKYACYVRSKDGPKPAFPGSFAAKVTSYQTCEHPMEKSLEAKSPCANLTTAQEATLVTLPDQAVGKKFAKSQGYQLVSVEAKFSLETWHMPSRNDNYVFVEVRRVQNETWYPEIIGTVKYMTERKDDLNTAKKLAEAVRVGYYCVDDSYNNTERTANKPGGGTGFGSAPSDYSASYMGVTNIDGRTDQVRHWTVYFQQEFMWNLYDTAVVGSTNPTTGEQTYHPVRLEAIHVESNTMIKRIDFGPMEVLTTSQLNDLKSKPGLDKPATCHQHGKPLKGVSASADPGGGKVVIDDWLASASPYPNADKSTIERVKTLDKEKPSMNLTSVDDMYKGFYRKPPANYNITTGKYNRRRRLMSAATSALVGENYVDFAFSDAAEEASAVERWDSRHLLGGAPNEPARPENAWGGGGGGGYSCCKRSGISTTSIDQDILDFDVNIGIVQIGVGFSMHQGFSGGTHCFQGFALDGGAGVGIKWLAGLTAYVEGSGYFDWHPVTGTSSCFEGGGCIAKGLRFEAFGGLLSIDLIKEILCFVVGRGDDDRGEKKSVNCNRGYIAVMKGVSLGSTWFIGVVEAQFWVKIWMQDDSCPASSPGRTHDHIDVYLQMNYGFPCAFGHCHWFPSSTHYFINPAPGHILKL